MARSPDDSRAAGQGSFEQPAGTRTVKPSDSSAEAQPETGGPSLDESTNQTRTARSDKAGETPDDNDLRQRTDSHGFSLREPGVAWSVAKGVWLADRYEMIEVIGAGGMGSVWLARQHQPVQRDVAVKLIKAGVGSAQALARFHLERQTLGLMEHPSIASIYDGGVNADGSPWFVMELVRGHSIIRFADRECLPIRRRLELFVEVCAGIHHAHQKGIIHRDIKPSNVLVAVHSDRAVPKIIDFGVAKVIDMQPTGEGPDTGAGIVGTPQYMSPEQATWGSGNIDTRSDIYSLGVLLYELLTGSTPFQSETRSSDLQLLLKQIREVDPIRPSTRVQHSGSRSEISRSRSSEPARLASELRNELDWIVIRALEKDRERRYGSAAEFARDIQRYLAGEAVLAHPPSRRYRLRKFVSRHRGPVAAASLLGLSLAAGIVGTSWGMLEAKQQTEVAFQEAGLKTTALLESERQRKVAIEAEKKALSAEREASRRASELDQVANFQAAQLSKIDPRRMGEQLQQEFVQQYLAELNRMGLPESQTGEHRKTFETAVQGVNFTDAAVHALEANLLDEAIRSMETELADQPTVLARLLSSAAVSFEGLGLYHRSIEAHRRAHSLLQQALGETAPDTILSLTALAFAHESNLELEEAERLNREAIRLWQRNHPNDDAGIAVAQSNLAGVLYSQGRKEEAEEWYARSRSAGGEPVAAEDPEMLEALQLNNQAALALEEGRLKEAEADFRDALEVLTTVLGRQHPTTIITVSNLGSALERQNKLDEALVYRREALRDMRRERGDAHPVTLKLANKCGVLLWQLGRLDEAIDVFESIDRNSRGVLSDNHPDRLEYLANLSVNYREAKRYERCISLLEDLLKLEISDAFRQRLRTDLFETLILGGKVEALERWIAGELEALRADKQTDPLQLAGRLAFFSMAWFRTGQWSRAEPLLTESLNIRREKAPAAWSTAVATSMMGELKFRLGDPAAGEPLMLEGAEALRTARFPKEMLADGQADNRRNEACQRLIELYESLKKPEAAAPWRALLK